ncbi:MAG: amidohydrolase family protein [Steroidobacteraceae bacterium]
MSYETECSRRSFLVGSLSAALGAGGAVAMAADRAAAPRGRLIDVHHHVFPPAYMQVNAALVAARSRGYTQVLDWTPEQSLADMDAGGTTTAVLSMTAPVWISDAATAVGLARDANDYAASLVQRHPGRLAAFVTLPLPEIDGSLAELARGLDELHFPGVALLSNYSDAYLGEPQFAPLLAELDRRGAVAYVHPTVAGCCQNLVRDLAPAFLELPFDTTRTVASLLYSGALSQYRRIRWIFAHGGGTLPFLADRLSQWAKARPDLAARLPDGPMAELRRLHFDTASVTNAAAVAAIGQLVPWTQVLFGTDFPYVHSAAQRAELARSLPATRDRAAVEYGNAARLLGI